MDPAADAPSLPSSRTSSTASFRHSLDVLSAVFLVSNRVVAMHRRHFLGLSVFSLIPLAVLTLAGSVPLPSFHPAKVLVASSANVSSTAPTTTIVVIVVGTFLYLCAAATVSHSVHGGFYGRPVKLIPSLCTLPTAFVRLAVTTVAAAVPIAAIATVVLLAIHLFPTANMAHIVLFTAAVVIALYLAVNWSLAGPITVIESRFGTEALKRSSALVVGMRQGILGLITFFGVSIGLTIWAFSLHDIKQPIDGYWGEIFPVVVKTVLGAMIIALLLLYGLVINVVLYMYCRAMHGELTQEVFDEYSEVYITLPTDEAKELHAVRIV